MYAQHFGLSANPFPLTPDPADLYLGKQHREAFAALKYGLIERRGFVTLVGEVGTGKTSLVYRLLRDLGPDVRTAYLANPLQSFEDILASLLQDLGVRTAARTKRGILGALNKHLRARADAGGTTALVIDEAQDLSDQALEEIRLLSNFETYTQKLVQIVLVGQPELRERLAEPHLRQLRERIAVHAVIGPLSRAEMRQYIEHCLQRAGGSSDRLFTRAALRLIVRRCAGIPRRANILCHNALLFAYGRRLPRVSARVAREEIGEMGERGRGRALVRRMLVGTVAAGVAIVAMVLTAGGRPRSTTMTTVASVPVRPSQTPDVAGADATIATVGNASASPLPETPRPDPSEATAAAVAVEAVVAPSVDSPSRAEPLVVTVPAGATLFSLVRSVYGLRVQGDHIYDDIRRLNPQLKDPDRIRAGASLRLPRGHS
jgi:general secretion pathway protein A